MSAPLPARDRAERWERLPAWLRPRREEAPGMGRVRLVETTLLLIVALLLVTATIDDVARQVGVDHRLSADVQTWRRQTGHAYHNLAVDQQLFGTASQREVVCGNTRPGPPKSSRQLCLEIWGPVVNGVRSVHGGWYLPPYSEDVPSLRQGCFGDATVEELCQR